MKIANSLCALTFALVSSQAFAQTAGPAAPFGSAERTMAPVETYGAGPVPSNNVENFSPSPAEADSNYMFGTGSRNGRATRPRGPIGSASAPNGKATAVISPTGRATAIPGGSTPGVVPQ